ncbi:MAG: hypothetical protein PHV74_04315 [Dehalococcoidia bacterium]|nr:hypothetical protein [Dehalococcoidia bacterium]
MKEQIRSAEQMVKMFKEDTGLLERLKAGDTVRVLEETAPKAVERADIEIAYFGDKLVYRIAVGVLGSLAILAAIGSIVLVLQDKTTPEVLVALGSAAVGALVGLFATPPK